MAESAPSPPFVSRAAIKLDHGLTAFGLDVAGFVCADLGCNAGGFTDVLLRRGAAKVYAVDTGYGMLDYRLRKDVRVVAMERTNAMHVVLPEAIDLVVIDVAWTKQRNILPSAARLLKAGAAVITLVKPHYEADPADLRDGSLPADRLQPTLASVDNDIQTAGFVIRQKTQSPIVGKKTGTNVEFLYLVKPHP
jgi:23S rRNA (cytidine1920-2'-O)/16S rRNA (cytidine1409-2'-O)-methyltransferase